MNLMLSSSLRELAHQQFVSVRERGSNDRYTSLLGPHGANSGNTKYARQHCHGTVWYGANKVDRETLVETAPSLKVYDFPRGVYDA